MSVSTPVQYQRSTFPGSSKNPRNLSVFIDGTSNKPGSKATNVHKLWDEVQRKTEGSGPQQDKKYWSGIGTNPNKSRLYNYLDMAFALSVDENVKEAYRWLVKNYRGGDQIYLFGFSRGAYQVRVLASLIHEVGLVRDEGNVAEAYGYYLSIDPYNPITRARRQTFKKLHCWEGVKTQFVGVWDTVSSCFKRDFHITASASVAHHFRHALALDERRIMFMPEYVSEVNASRSKIRDHKSAFGDVKEVWFPGSHSDVGGTSRQHPRVALQPRDFYPVHAGNVSLVWMRREAAAHGLLFDPVVFAWFPEDIGFGRKDSMTFWWQCLEILYIGHQVGGNDKHKKKRHWSRLRSVIPGQQIHSSVWSTDAYTPLATLGDGIGIPTVVWEHADEREMTRLWTSLLSDPSKALESLSRVLFLLNSSLDNELTQTIPKPQWSEKFIRGQSSFNRFALTVIYDVTSNFSASDDLLRDAKDTLSAILCSTDQQYFARALNILRFLMRHPKLRQRMIARDAHDELVVKGLMLALERTAKSRSKNLFLLVMDIIRDLIQDDDPLVRGYVIMQLSDRSHKTNLGRTRLSMALQVKVPSQLIASLMMITSFAQYQPDCCEELKPRIYRLAKKAGSPVGSAAVAVLVALNSHLPPDIRFSNILGYLCNTLPRLDAEVGGTSPPGDFGNLPSVLQVDGSGKLNGGIMHKLVSTIESRDTRKRTAATLTLLKLCGNPMIRDFCLRNKDKILDIFVGQLAQKATSLLAAYALQTCFKHKIWTSGDFTRAAQLIIAMLDKGWFDGVVGVVEGSEIFSKLMKHDGLRRRAVDLNIVLTLLKKLEDGEHHEVHMGLAYLNAIVESGAQVQLASYVEKGITYLRDENEKVQRKGVKILSVLAQIWVGEQAIKPHVAEIVGMVIPSAGGSTLLPAQRHNHFVALHNLWRNETLRLQIQASKEFRDLQAHHLDWILMDD